jgi:hypothetical protein
VSNRTEELAKIQGTFLGVEDHGILTAVIDLNYGSAGQGAGSLMFDYRNATTDEWHDNKGLASRWIRGVLGAAGVDSWEKLKGRTVIAIKEGGYVIGLKPLPFEP